MAEPKKAEEMELTDELPTVFVAIVHPDNELAKKKTVEDLPVHVTEMGPLEGHYEAAFDEETNTYSW